MGNAASGKTTFARRLSGALGVPHVELDSLFWRANWEMAPADEFLADVESRLTARGWVVDGNYHSRLGTSVLERADVVVWLDPPFRTILSRLLRRTVRRIRTHELLWGVNRETWSAFLARDSLLVWAMRAHLRRAATAEWLAPFDVVRFRSARDADAWLQDRERGGDARARSRR